MSDFEIHVADEVRPEDRQAISAGLTEHALPVTGVPGFRPLSVMARDARGALVGGVIGSVNWNWLHVALVWVAASHRRTGLGRRLMAEIERAAVARGCTHAHLDTFSYQARPFYERLGYRLFGTLADYPDGHQRFFLEKDLGR